MSRLTVSVLGEFGVRRDDERIPLGSRRTEALFVYLVLTGARQPREHLSELLWNAGNPGKAAGNLRVLLTNLRQNVGDFVDITRTSVTFTPPDPATVDVDVHRFRGLVRKPLRKRPGDLHEADVHALRTAARLCRGELLERFDLPDSPPFDDWIRTERNALHDDRVAVLTQLVEAALTEASVTSPLSVESALQDAAALIVVEPLLESSHQLMIRAQLRAGDEVAASRHYRLLEEMLQAELGTSPSPESKALVAALSSARTGSARPQLPAQAARPGAGAGPVPSRERPRWSRFVGRRSELASIVTKYAETVQGRGSVVAVRGGAGCGKSVLLRHAVRACTKQDPALVVLSGSCGDGGSAGSGLLLANLLAQLAGDASGSWPDGPMPPTLAERIGELAAIGDWPPDRASSPSASFVAGVRHLAARRPVVVALDDAQWASPAVVSILAELARDIRSRQLLVLLGARPGAVDLRGPGAGTMDVPRGTGSLAWLQTRLGRLPGYSTIDLDHDAASAREFLGALLASEPSDLPEHFVAQLLRRGRGHPLVSVERLRDLVRRGGIVVDSGARLALSEPLHWDVVPERVARLHEERLAEVPNAMMPLVECAAAQGECFDARVIAGVCERRTGEVVRAFGQVLGRDLGLVAPIDQSGSGDLSGPTHRFRHPTMRDQVLSRLDPLERRHLLDLTPGGVPRLSVEPPIASPLHGVPPRH